MSNSDLLTPVRIKVNIPADLPASETLLIAADKMEESGFDFMAEGLRSAAQDYSSEVWTPKGFLWTDEVGWTGKTPKHHLCFVGQSGKIMTGTTTALCGTWVTARQNGSSREYTTNPQNPCKHCNKGGKALSQGGNYGGWTQNRLHRMLEREGNP